MRRKPAHCSKVRGPSRAHLEQFLAAGERTGRVAMRDDRLGERRAEARHARQQRRRGGVEIDADGVHRILDHRIQRAAEPVLVDIVLVLADADRLRLDLDQFGQRVLQAPRDRHGAAQRHVEVGELGRRRRRRRIDRGAGLADDDLERLRAPGHVGQHVGHQLFGLAAAGAVADGDQLDLVLADERWPVRPACRARRSSAGTDRRSSCPAACRCRRPPRP